MPGGGGSVFTGAAGKIDTFPGSHPSRDLVDPIVAVETYLAGLIPAGFPTSYPTPGQLLATQHYTTSHAYTSSTGAVATLDTTNLTLPFTVPANGIVDVDVQFYDVNLTVTATASIMILQMMNHTGGATLGTAYAIAANGTGNSSLYFDTTKLRFHITGLTPGAYQVDVGSGMTFSGAGTAGTITSPCLIQAFASI